MSQHPERQFRISPFVLPMSEMLIKYFVLTLVSVHDHNVGSTKSYWSGEGQD